MVRIGIVIFPDVEELDFVGPFEVLSYINKITPNSTEVLLIAPSKEAVRAFNGLKVLPDTTLLDSPKLDILLFPGGKGRITIYSGKYPILLGSEVLNFQLPFDNQSKGGCLYATDR